MFTIIPLILYFLFFIFFMKPSCKRQRKLLGRVPYSRLSFKQQNLYRRLSQLEDKRFKKKLKRKLDKELF